MEDVHRRSVKTSFEDSQIKKSLRENKIEQEQQAETDQWPEQISAGEPAFNRHTFLAPRRFSPRRLARRCKAGERSKGARRTSRRLNPSVYLRAAANASSSSFSVLISQARPSPNTSGRR